MAWRRLPEIPVFAAVFLIIFMLMAFQLQIPERVNADEIRYIKYAVAIHDHGVFGLFEERDASSPPPVGRANVPLYPALISVVMGLDPAFAESMVCLVENRDNTNCPKPFRLFYIMQMLLGFLTVLFIFLISRRLSQNKAVPWIAALLVSFSGIFQENAGVFMTEIIALPLFCGFLYALTRYYQQRDFLSVILIGLFLGAMTMVRPSYLYLFYAVIIFFTFYSFIHFEKRKLLQAFVILIGFLVVIAPWSVRNNIHFGSFALTHSDYAEIVLIERTNYNKMSWPEVGVAMIYWLPDFGDSLAEKLFPEKLYNKLGWDRDSYYGPRSRGRIDQLTDELGSRDKILGHVLKHDVLTTKHISVSVPLALRGMYIGKYWGLLGLIAFAVFLVHCLRTRRYDFIIISLPVLYMVAFHAGLSVSIARYNLVLMALYAFAMAYYLEKYGSKIVTKIRSA
jgi:4-amino-4-deoxy-L-arabinose transferase-like glycosyltransferase